MGEDAGWGDYLAGFHAERPGITEAILARARRGGQDPYDWLAAQVPAGGRVLDLACGSGPLRTRLSPGRYLGVDASAAELAAARRRGVTDVGRADATRLPLGDASVDVVAASMALMLLPLDATLDEVRRVLRPRGRLVATLPATRPLTRGDLWRYARLLAALHRTGLGYPGDAALAHPVDVLARAGLRLDDDRRLRFPYPVRDRHDGRQLVRSLYLPGVEARRIAAAQRVAEGWVGTEVGVPIRRLTATALAPPR